MRDMLCAIFSNMFSCAKLCGIDPSIINLAEKIYEEKLKGGNFTTFFLNCSPEEEKKMRIAVSQL